MAEPIYKELAKHLQSMTVSVMEKVLPQLANGPFNVMYGSEASRILRAGTLRYLLSATLCGGYVQQTSGNSEQVGEEFALSPRCAGFGKVSPH
jgi:hypothetical protein